MSGGSTPEPEPDFSWLDGGEPLVPLPEHMRPAKDPKGGKEGKSK